MTAPSADPADADLAFVDSSPSVKLCAALHGIAGAVCALAGLQFVTSGFSFYQEALHGVPWALVVLGAIELAVALLVLRNHLPAAIAGAIVAPVLAIVALGWLILSVTSGMMSFLALAAVPSAGGASILAPFTLSSVRRGWNAKKRLRASGMELGL